MTDYNRADNRPKNYWKKYLLEILVVLDTLSHILRLIYVHFRYLNSLKNIKKKQKPKVKVILQFTI